MQSSQQIVLGIQTPSPERTTGQPPAGGREGNEDDASVHPLAGRDVVIVRDGEEDKVVNTLVEDALEVVLEEDEVANELVDNALDVVLEADDILGTVVMEALEIVLTQMQNGAVDTPFEDWLGLMAPEGVLGSSAVEIALWQTQNGVADTLARNVRDLMLEEGRIVVVLVEDALELELARMDRRTEDEEVDCSIVAMIEE